MGRCILAATDGEARSLGALRCAFDLGERAGLAVEVASVCEPSAGVEAGMLMGAAGGRYADAEAAREIRRSRVDAQLPYTPDGPGPTHVEMGIPGRVIGNLAGQLGAELIVIGRGRHGAVERLLGEETAPRLMQSAHVPVLCVPEDYAGLPGRALVAVDFSTHSLDACCVAARLLPAGAELHIVHVASSENGASFASASSAEWTRAMRQELESRLQEVARRIAQVAPHVRVATHTREGRPVPAILALAEELDADLLASGTSGYGYLGRLLAGSVATQLVRRTRRMTLIAPPRDIVPRCAATWEGLLTEPIAC